MATLAIPRPDGTDTTSSPGPAGAPLLRILAWAVLYILPVAIAVRPILDLDVWWHLRTGEWIVATGHLPQTDPFSQHGLQTGEPWVAYSWLFEVLLYGAYRFLGFAGVFLFRAVLTAGIVLALHRLVAKRSSGFVVIAAVTGVGVLALLPLVAERPWLFTILFGTLTLDVLLDLREGRAGRRAWLLPLLFVLWANIHIQFVYGLFILGLGCVAPVCDRLLGRPTSGRGADTLGSRPWWTLVAITALCTAATLVTPYHIHVYQVVLQYATQKVALREIAECQALAFRDAWDWSALAVGAAAAFSLGRRVRLSAFDVLLLASAAWFAFRGRRDVWFLVLAALAVVATARRAVDVERVFWPTRRAWGGVAFLALPVLVAYGWFAMSGNHVQATMETEYPVKAVEYVREHGCRGPLFNPFNWGGYLMWNLRELPVSMDGRANLYGDALLARSVSTWRGQPGWDADPELAAAATVLAPADAPLTALLREEKRFRVAYEDKVAVVFVAAHPGGFSGIQPFFRREAGPAQDLPDEPRVYLALVRIRDCEAERASAHPLVLPPREGTLKAQSPQLADQFTP